MTGKELSVGPELDAAVAKVLGASHMCQDGEMEPCECAGDLELNVDCGYLKEGGDKKLCRFRKPLPYSTDANVALDTLRWARTEGGFYVTVQGYDTGEWRVQLQSRETGISWQRIEETLLLAICRALTAAGGTENYVEEVKLGG